MISFDADMGMSSNVAPKGTNMNRNKDLEIRGAMGDSCSAPKGCKPVDVPPSVNAGNGDEESGYVIPMTALMLIPLLIFAAFAIDVGAWYLKGQQIQRATDAAALAGVIHMPDLGEAEEVALDVAARNGFVDQRWVDAGNTGTVNATVQVTEKGDQVQVRIQSESPAFLGRIVLDEVDVERYSVADIASDVGFGNPTSGLGTGNLPSSMLGSPDGGGSYAHGVWLSVNSYCTGHAQGDPFSTGFYDPSNRWNECINGTSNPVGTASPNPTFKPEQDMYDYIVDIPEGAGSTNIQVWDPGTRCGGANDSGGPRLQFRTYAKDDTPDHHLDNLERTPVFNQTFGRSSCGWRNLTLQPIPASQHGKWYVRVNARAPQRGELGINNFALRAVPSTGSTELCARSGSDPTCPSIYAREWVSFYRPSWGSSGVSTEFYLAQITEEHAGKKLQVRLFDPGEGMDNLKFFDDHGNAADFTFRRTNCSVGKICNSPTAWPEDVAPRNADRTGCGGGEPCLKVTNSRYNAEWITLEVDLPADYTCDSSCWWKVRYTPEPGRTPTDRTTWSVKVIGDPAHLTE